MMNTPASPFRATSQLFNRPLASLWRHEGQYVTPLAFPSWILRNEEAGGGRGERRGEEAKARI